MTILKSAYDACEAVVGALMREDIRRLIRSLNTTPASPPSGYVDRSAFGYFARQQRAQFAGYLLIDQERARLANAPLPFLVPALTSEERHLLKGAHYQLLQTNVASVASVTVRYPALANAIDPYGRLLPLAETVPPKSLPFPNNAFDGVIQAFAGHPALPILLSTPPGMVAQLTSLTGAAAVNNLESALWKAGPGKTPTDITTFLMMEPTASPNRAFGRLVAALLSLRAGLQVFDQMMFQATLTDKPPVLDEDNLIDLKHLGTSFAGEGIRAVYQPQGITDFLDVGDLVLLKRVPKGLPLQGLLLIESVQSSMSNEFGFTNTIAARVVDDNLNPYAGFPSRF